MTPNLVAFTGYARVGKDEAAKVLIQHGYERRCFGDIIKSMFDELCIQNLGFSAFTEDDAQKKMIRPILEQGGEVFYDPIFSKFFRHLPPKAVNTRLCREREAVEWKRRGGIIIEIRRSGVGPSTEWENKQVESLRRRDLIDAVILNDWDVRQLHADVESTCGL